MFKGCDDDDSYWLDVLYAEYLDADSVSECVIKCDWYPDSNILPGPGGVCVELSKNVEASFFGVVPYGVGYKNWFDDTVNFKGVRRWSEESSRAGSSGKLWEMYVIMAIMNS